MAFAFANLLHSSNVLGLSGRTASQVELSSHTTVLDTTAQCHVTLYKKLGFALSNTNENSPFDG